MDYSVTFARHFSRLVWLLLHEPTAIDEQKAALRALVTVSKEGPVTMSTREWRLVVNDALLPEALTGVQDLAAQLTGHAVQQLTIDRAAAPADLLGAARILASEAVPGDGGRAVEERLRALDAKTVHVTTAGLLGVNLDGMDASLVEADSFADVTPEPAAPPATDAAPAAPSGEPRSGSTAIPPRTSGPVRSAGGLAGSDDFIDRSSGGAYLAFAAVPTPTGAAADLFAQLDGTHSVNVTTRLLDELVTMAENAQREGKQDTVGEVFYGVVRREAELPDSDQRRAYVMAVRRMAKPTLLRTVAQLLPRRREYQDEYMAVLTRTGEDGADALIEQLTNAQSLAERRVYFDSLLLLNAGIPALVHMLGDARWYVARNAADLLGEMQAAEAEGPLAELLKHDDDRVRRAAANALAKIGTPKAVQGLHVALRDTSPDVRKQAAAGLALRKGQKSANTLSRALDDEGDAEVQLEILRALGRLATPDAVQKLVKAAEPEGRLFKKKAVAYRVAAVRALGEARTPAALTALQSLVNDREREVREAVFQVMVQAGSGNPEKAGA
jgi:HEAT repeat protein